MRTGTIKILDMFCGEGGASMGYYRSASTLGIQVLIIGVDIRPMKRYPFEFLQANALSLDYEYLDSFDFIHASPPCKAYTKLSRFSSKDTDKTILPRLLTTLEAAGKPYVVENVPQAPIRADIQLDGTMFDLAIKRRRIFQTNLRIEMPYPRPTTYTEKMNVLTVAGNVSVSAASKAMGIDWMSQAGIRESIPPAYTQWIGEQLFCEARF